MSFYVSIYHFKVRFNVSFSGPFSPFSKPDLRENLIIRMGQKTGYILERNKTYFSLCERVFKIDNGWKKNKFIHDKMQI